MLVCKHGIAKQVRLTMVSRKGMFWFFFPEGCVPVRETAFTDCQDIFLTFQQKSHLEIFGANQFLKV